MFYDRKKYVLYSGDKDYIEVEEPLEWETDEKSFIRNNSYHSIDVNLSGSLTFIGFGKDI